MPDEFPVDELIERLLFVQGVQEGLLESERGETVPLEEVRQRLRNMSAVPTVCRCVFARMGTKQS